MTNNINGQICEGSLFAKCLEYIFDTFSISHIVEIGTWKGLGSTKLIIDNIIKHNTSCNFLTLETNKVFFDIATKNLEAYKSYVNLIYGSIINPSLINDYLQMFPINNLSHVIWLYEDLVNLQKCPNVYHMMPTSIDLLLLDGGEFSTYAEWNLLKKRSKIVALDDTLTLKCSSIRKEILNDTQYEIIIDSNDRNGFMIARNQQHDL